MRQIKSLTSQLKTSITKVLNSPNILPTLGLCLLGIAILCPHSVFATTDFGAAEIESQATGIKDFLFGPVLRIGGILGGAWGLLQTIVTSSYKPILLYGGAGALTAVIPSFIDGVFSANTMLIPW